MRQVLFVFAVVALGCTSGQFESPSGSPAGGKADEPMFEPSLTVARFSGLREVALVARSACTAGNGAHFVGTYDVFTFDPALVMEELRALDAEAHGCVDRHYSTSAESGAAEFETFLSHETYRETLTECAEGPFGLPAIADPEGFNEDWLSLVGDPENLGVFSSVPKPGSVDDPFLCEYFQFLIFRPDGTALRLYYDYSD